MNEQRHGDGWWVITFVIGVVGLAMGIVGIAIASGKAADGTSAAPAAVATGETEFDVTLADISVSPSMIEVPAGALVTLHVTNDGTLDHDLKVLGETGVELLKSGASADVQIGPFTADTEVWCTVPGHKEAGMKMAVHVLGGTGAAAGSGTGSGSGSGTGSGAASNSAVIDGAAMPPDGWAGRDPALAPALTGTVHEIAFDAIEAEIEVAPGVTQLMWTFNGTVPGPTLHGKIGDTFRITIVAAAS